MKDYIKDENGIKSLIDSYFSDNKHISIHKPESYPCIITWHRHDIDGYGG